MTRTAARLLLLPPLALTFACGGAADVSVTRTDSAGVAIVVTDGPDRPLEWRFEERFRLGGADEGPESFYSLSRGGVATDSAGAIYVLEGTAHRVVVFDSQGRHLRTFGRRGSGPGELEFAVGVAVDGDGVVGVWDYGKSGLVRFGPGGEPLPGFRSNAFYRGRGLHLLEDGAVFTTTDLRDPEAHRDALVVLDTTGAGEGGAWAGIRGVASIVQPPAALHTFETCGIAMRLPPLFFPGLEWAAGPDGRLFVNEEVGYVVDVYADSAHVASYRRSLEPRAATRALAERSLGAGMTVSVSGGPPCTIPPGDVLEARGFADRIPFVAELAVDPAGRIWLQRSAIGDEPARTDIMGPDGAYIGTLIDAPAPLAFLPNGDLLAGETDEMDVDRLVVYRVVRSAR